MKRYQAIIFDLFSTVALWRPARMPLFEWRGKTSPSTMGELRATIEERVTQASFGDFVDGLAAANETLAERRQLEQREFPSLHRFELALTNVGYASDNATRELAEILSGKHMELLAAAVDIPAEHVKFLEKLSATYPLALVSNFDHGPTARAILVRDGAMRFFDPIIISDEHGRRKPHASIFLDALGHLELRPDQALYVGDSVEDDIVGAKGAGLDIAWVNARDQALPPKVPEPDHTVAAIPELTPLILAG